MSMQCNQKGVSRSQAEEDAHRQRILGDDRITKRGKDVLYERRNLTPGNLASCVRAAAAAATTNIGDCNKNTRMSRSLEKLLNTRCYGAIMHTLHYTLCGTAVQVHRGRRCLFVILVIP